ncbi:MAG: hypothetical protein J6J24_00355 [Clostridia bacterium]|nr:hypothetical protein [Clostridia bacterium]
MFSHEFDGYKKQEVENFIETMKASYEARLMEEKLKVLDSEKKVLDLKNERYEIENKEKNIMTALNAIEKAKKFQEEGSQKLYRLIVDKMELLIKELNLKFPSLRKDPDFDSLLSEFANMVQNYKATLERTTSITNPIYSENDSMRLLLNKMHDYKKFQEPVKEVHIQINSMKKPVSIQEVPQSESGFNFEEALNPTQDLDEIMKAFDFYNG